MPRDENGQRRRAGVWRAVIEIAFIIFLFYSNLLRGESSRLSMAVAVVSALFGYAGFEYLRKRL
jgi:hypothetical protein